MIIDNAILLEIKHKLGLNNEQQEWLANLVVAAKMNKHINPRGDKQREHNYQIDNSIYKIYGLFQLSQAASSTKENKIIVHHES